MADESRWDFDLWAENHVPEHVDAITRLLSARRAPPLEVDPLTGHLNPGGLCWVCFARQPLRDRRIPRFRACRTCLIHDRQRASALGMTMLLPLMQYPSQPILPGATPPRDAHLRAVLADVWSQLSILDRWRIEGVRLGYALFNVEANIGAGVGIEYAEWQERLSPGRERSRACWAAFVQGYPPDLMARLHSA